MRLGFDENQAIQRHREAEGGGAARRLTPTRSEMKGRNPDGCHMNEAGTLANAALWAAFIK
jgi:hypothetical protein